MRISWPASHPIWTRLRPTFWSARFLAAFLCLCGPGLQLVARAQDQIETIERLYTAADYEAALSLAEKIEPFLLVDKSRVAEIRILCLLALGQSERAQLAIEKLVERIPRYRPDPERFSPARVELFEAVRRRVLPRIIETRYAEAKASFDAKDYERAVQQFEILLDLLKDPADYPRFAALRTLASGLLEVARRPDATAENAIGTSGTPLTDERVRGVRNGSGRHVSTGSPGQPSRGLENSAPGRIEPIIYDTSAVGVVPPAALTPILPPASVPSSVVTPKSGLFEIVVGESGRVESVSVRRSIHSQYDALVVNESRNWRFKPATRDGQPVKFRKLIEIYAAPLASIRE